MENNSTPLLSELISTLICQFLNCSDRSIQHFFCV